MSEVLSWSLKMLSAIQALDEADRQRSLLLNAIARGETTLDARQSEQLASLNRDMVARLSSLSVNVQKRVRADQLSRDAGALPSRFVELYSLLCYAAYGMDNTQMGDPSELGKAEGKEVHWRTKSDVEEKRGGAKPAKKFGSGRILVKNERAFARKRAIDQKLRRIGVDIERFLAGESRMGRGIEGQFNTPKCCSKCGRYCDQEWRFCVSCGGHVIDVPEDRD